ncbi:MAG: Crp/Fnr family transcriptional regulator, partial [Hymenobacter sp.]|nr:Crp/Fnr family transcriptional regulator [Hymenobacter sp.]
MDAFLAICQAIHPLSEPLREALRELTRRETLPRRHQLLRVGQVAQRLYFLETDVVHGFYLKDGRQLSSWFMKDGDFVISIASFFSQQPSSEAVELLADS